MNIKVPSSVHHFFGKATGLSPKDVKELYSPTFLAQAVNLGKGNAELGVQKLLQWYSKSNAFGDPLLMSFTPSKKGRVSIKAQPGVLLVDLPILLKDYPKNRPIKALDFGSGHGLSTFSLAATLKRLGLDFLVKGVDIQKDLIERSNTGKYTDEDIHFGIFSPEAKEKQQSIWDKARDYIAIEFTSNNDLTQAEQLMNRFSNSYRNNAITKTLLPFTKENEDGFREILPPLKGKVAFQHITPFNFTNLGNGNFDFTTAETVFTMFTPKGKELALRGLASVTDRHVIVDLPDTSPDERVNIPAKIMQNTGFQIADDGILEKIPPAQNFDMKARK